MALSRLSPKSISSSPATSSSSLSRIYGHLRQFNVDAPTQTSFAVPTPPESFGDTNLTHSVSPQMETLSGWPDDVMLAIAEISALAHWKSMERIKGTLNYRDLIHWGDDTEQRLRHCHRHPGYTCGPPTNALRNRKAPTTSSDKARNATSKSPPRRTCEKCGPILTTFTTLLTTT
ncbi:hypothetical protein F5890DRAFT_1593966 [Lentinula detonsa]|uniref:Uncharacterized protein n=1 Tax=Lentinula detonsa TaxID=2804962 RepID=A0AA38PMZ6_9AGAR|nr:hypothetical protein F5890DRAFT_1593966 [Lentinula detonsa]